MKFANPTRALLLGAALVAVAAASLATSALRATPTQAGIVANEYSMEVRIASTNVAVSATFQVQLFIEHGGVTDPLDCFDGLVNGIDDDGDTPPLIDEPGLPDPGGDPALGGEQGLGSPFVVPPFGCYAGAQWYLQYNGIYVDLPTGTGNITKVGAAPAACNQEFDDGALNRALVACSTTLGLPNAELAYTGAAWNLQFTCVAAGFADFTLITTGTGEVTFVNDGNVNLPIHTHADSVECGTGGPTRTNTPGPTSTPTPFPTALPTSTPTNTATPCTGACPTVMPSPTVHPRHTDTPVPDATETPGPATPAVGETPGAPAATATKTGAGRPGGVLIGPDTGSGPGGSEGATALLWVWLAVGAAGTALAAAGAYGQWRTGRR